MGDGADDLRYREMVPYGTMDKIWDIQEANMNNGALDEAMGIIKGSLADNSQVEKPYRTTGQIFYNDYKDIFHIFVDGIPVVFEVRHYIDPDPCDLENPKTIADNGWQQDKNGQWYIENHFASAQKRM